MSSPATSDSRFFALMTTLWVIVLHQTHTTWLHILAAVVASLFGLLALELDRHAATLVSKLKASRSATRPEA